MEMDNDYSHALAVVFTQEGDAVVVDSNPDRPEYADAVIRQWVESLGFRYRVSRLPSMNQYDSDSVREVLKKLAIDTPVTIGGYCVSLTLTYLIDMLCTERYDDSHLTRFFNDIAPPNAHALVTQVCIVLYARAITNDCLKMCMRRLRTGNVRLPPKWPSSVPIDTDHTTRTVTWQNVKSAVASLG